MTAATAQADCVTNGVHWYGRGSSGCCAVGTDIVTATPAHWSAQQGSASNVAAWLITINMTNTPSIETGFYTGYFPYKGDNHSGLLPYYTLENGTSGWRKEWDWLVASTYYHLTAVQGNSGHIEVGWGTPQDWQVPISYPVAQGTNSSQGEVTVDPNTWMGGGPYRDEVLSGYSCQGACSSWIPWSWNVNCDNAPYKATWYYSNAYAVQGPDH